MASIIENESTGANFSASARTRSSTNPAKTYGSGANFVRNADPGGGSGPLGDGLLTEGGDFLLTESGSFLVLE